MATFKCPKCGERCPVSKKSSSKGTKVTCSACGSSFVVKGVKRKGKGNKGARGSKATKEVAATSGDIASDATLPGEPVSGAETEIGKPDAVTPKPSLSREPTGEQISGSPDEEEGGHISTKVIPGFKIMSLLGQGGMGAVYMAKQLSLDRIVALKILAKRLSTIPDFVKRFENEAKALATLNHPNITAIFDRGVAKSYCYFAMEYVEGQSLAQRLVASKLTPSEAIEIFLDICEAVSFSHEKGIIHRDLKPGNILIAINGRVKVTDFGLAGMVGERAGASITRTNMVMGTVNYMAPEQRRDAKSVDHRADIYSMGVILYELLTGHLPLGHFELPSEALAGQVSRRLDEIVLKALSFAKEQRYDSVAALAKDLREISGNLKEAIPMTTTATVISGADGQAGGPTMASGGSTLTGAAGASGPAGASGADGTLAGAAQATQSDTAVLSQSSAPGLQPSAAATVIENAASSQVHQGVTVIQDGPLSLPPVEVQQVERAAGRIFLMVLALLFVVVGIPALLPEEYVPAPILSVRREVAEWLTGAEAAKKSKIIQDKMSNARALFRERKWQETVDELDECLVADNPNLLEARYMSGKSLAEWGATGGPEGGPDRNILQEALLRLKEIDDDMETTRRYPDLLFYRARVQHLLGEWDEAEELYRSCIARELNEQPARLEYSLLLKDQKRYSEAVSTLSTGITTFDKYSVNRILPVFVQTYEHYESGSTIPEKWLALANLAQSVNRKSWAPREYAYISALSTYFSAKKDEQEISPLQKLVSGKLPADKLLSRLYGQCLYLISQEYLRRRKANSAVKAYEDYIAWAERTNQAKRSELSKSRYELGTLLVNVLHSRYSEAANHLRKVAIEDRDELDYYNLALGAALFRAAWSRDQPLIPPIEPSKELDSQLAEADEVFRLTIEPFAKEAEKNIDNGRDGNQVWRPLLNSKRALALVSMARWRFEEALSRWRELAERVAALRSKGFDYGDKFDEANLAIALLSCDIPRVRSIEEFQNRCRMLTDKAGKGSTANAYWYCRAVSAYLNEASIEDLEKCIRKINGEYGSSVFFKGIVKSKLAGDKLLLLEDASKTFEVIVGSPTFWAVEALCELGDLALKRAKNTTQGKNQQALLDEAKGHFTKYLGHANIRQEKRAKSGLERIDVMKAEMKGLTDMTMVQLQQALKYVEVSNRRTAIIALLSKKLVAARRAKEAEELLIAELGKDHKNHILQSELALLVSRNVNCSKDRAISLLTKAWELCLAAREHVSNEIVTSLEKYTVNESAEDAAQVWEKLLTFDPAQSKVLAALARRLEEVGEFGRIVSAFSAAAKAKEGDLAMLYELLSWKFKAAKQLLLEDEEQKGRQLIDEVIKSCSNTESAKSLDVIAKARFLLLEGRAHRELRIRYREGTHLPNAIKAYTAAVDTLGQVSDIAGLSIAANAYLDLAEVYVDAEKQDFGVKYLNHAVNVLEKLVELDKSHSEDNILRYRQSVTNLVWSLNNTQRYKEALQVAGHALSKVPVGDVPLAILYGVLALRRRPFSWCPPVASVADVARQALEGAAATDPGDIRVRLLLVEAYLASSKVEAAHRELVQVEKLVNDEMADLAEDDMVDEVDEKRAAQIALIRGRVEAARGHRDEAEKAFKEVIAKNYEVWDGRFQLALLKRHEIGTQSSAFTSAVAALAGEVRDEDLTLAQRCQLADLQLLDDNPEEATRTLGRPSTFAGIEYRRAISAFGEGKYSQSLTILSSLADKARAGSVVGLPCPLVLHRFQGLASLELGDRKAASEFLNECLKLSPSDYWTNYHLARLAAEKRSWQVAEAHISFVLKERIDFSGAYLASTIALGNKDNELAWRRAQLATSASPKEAAGHFLEGHVALVSGRGRSRAASSFERAAQLAPTWARPLEELGLLYLDEPQRAEESFRRVETQEMELSTRGSLGLGLALALQKRDKEALLYLLEATVDEDIQAVAARNLGAVLERLQLGEEAKKWYRFAGDSVSEKSSATGATDSTTATSAAGATRATSAAGATRATSSSTQSGYDW